MKLRNVGYGKRPIGVSAAQPRTSDRRIEYRRSLLGNDSVAGAITEWYVNTASGLEQGFTLESAPGERKDGERLGVVLALESGLRARAMDGGQALEFTDGAGQRVLRYDHLVVRGGRGRELEAQMAVRTEGGEGEVWLEVDDRVAVWPVTIDPTSTRQDKLLAADAASFDGFGASVAISGETVVVGAVQDDGAAGLDQGSAYVLAPETPSDAPPTITLKAPISLWSLNHKYQAAYIRQMVQSASDTKDGDLLNSVVIEKATSDEPDNAPEGADGNTSNDIVIAGDRKSVQLRSERDETKNGRVYSVTVRVS